jgi:ABC-2 type transport system permease protein
LDILPPVVSQVLACTPFPYQLFFPVSVYLGRVTGPELWQGLAIQACWVVAAYGLARWLWQRGIRHYGAVGG